MTQPLIITVAAVGAELSKEDQPGLPITLEELAEDAAACAEAGASIYHLHVRDPSGHPTMDVETFISSRAAIEASSDLIVQFTTGGAVGDPDEARLAPLRSGPEMATLTTGTVNFGDQVFHNPIPLIRRLYEVMRGHGVLPEYEIFEAGMIATAVRLFEELGQDHHRHFDFVLGVPGALPAWEDVLPFLVSKLPDGSTWGATGIGRAHVPVVDRTLALGGHVRTGMEDVRYTGPGQLVESNAELIRKVAEKARGLGRSISSPSETREILGFP